MTQHKYDRVRQHIRHTIHQGHYQADDKLPSIRHLSEQLEVSRNTVIRAYQELEAAGMVYAVAKSGYRVKASPEQIGDTRPPSEVDLLSVSKEFLTYDEGSALLPMGSAHPYTDTTGIRSLYATVARHSRKQSHIPCHYQLPPGNEQLLKQITKISHDRGVMASRESIAITHGAQQAISLALQAVTHPGDIVAVESPCYFGNLLLLESLGLQVIEIPSCNRTGVEPDALKQALAQWQIKAIILTPNFANPTGATLPLDKRQALLEISRDIPIIEDDVFGALHFDQPIDSLYSLDPSGRVIYVNSLSKTLDSRLRIGWIASTRYQPQIEKRLISDNMGSLNLIQSGLADFLSTGKYRLHLNKMCRLYQSNLKQFSQLLLHALNQYPELSGRYHLTQPDGAFINWLTLPDDFDSYAFYQTAKQQRISVLPGTVFGTADQYRHCLRLCFAHFQNNRQWHQGIAQFAAMIARQVNPRAKTAIPLAIENQ
ncbi:PLP-dependent aminotransferase family protein [Vibrio sp.]|uniref:aminotransferase-like domain-containing protein n=1 Tax=Vibrio sp. TaxID=678 RepID=UPI003D147640